MIISKNNICLLGDFDVEEDDIPRTEFKPSPLIPKEENRVGCNKKAYFVCNEGKQCRTYMYYSINL
jgi:hypothetical protein